MLYQLRQENHNLKIFTALLGGMLAITAGLAVYELDRADYYAGKAKAYAEAYADELEADIDDLEDDIDTLQSDIDNDAMMEELQACFDAAGYGDYCTAEYTPAGELVTVTLNPEDSAMED